MKHFYLTLLAFFCLTSGFPQKFEKLAMTPPMGWNSWNRFECEINEQVVRDAADAMVSSGMKEAGYEYIVIDDCWQIGRDKQGFHSGCFCKKGNRNDNTDFETGNSQSRSGGFQAKETI